ncbi:hypothetical protein [Campylobacter curvus]|uniref:hypothetical protein n=1 Tax=Campylobacter curvus TaxID=200 RepID=UPI00146FF3E0|nr:hypothetical protein [Campylobacter curvus]
MRVGEVYSVVAMALAANFNEILDVAQFMRIKKSKGWIVQNKTHASKVGGEFYAKFLKDESSAALCDDFVLLKPKFLASHYFPSAKDDLAKFYKSIKFEPKADGIDSVSNQLLLIAAILKNEANENSQRLLAAFSSAYFLPYANELAKELQTQATSNFYKAMGYFLEDFCTALGAMIGKKQKS